MLQRLSRQESGANLIETAVMLPLLLIIAFNAVNFGYAFFVTLNVAAAPRTGVQFSTQGFETPSTPGLPADTQVSTLTYADMTGVLPNSGNTPMQVCMQTVIVSGKGTNGSGASLRTNCSSFNNAGGPAFPTPAPDPEAPRFVLNRVDVRYTPAPLIPGGVFNVLPVVVFHRQVSMRSMD
jgi:Flp pilus assembly protein TadG